MSGVNSGLGLCVLVVASAGLLSTFTSALFSAERDWRLLGVDVSWRSARGRAETTSDGAASPGDTGDMMGALTGREFLSGVDAIAAGERRGGGEKIAEIYKQIYTRKNLL